MYYLTQNQIYALKLSFMEGLFLKKDALHENIE